MGNKVATLKNINLDKYVTNHVQQHNLTVSLIYYGGTGLDKHLKINYFLMGIQSSDFDTIKASITANPEWFTKFDMVKDHFLDI